MNNQQTLEAGARGDTDDCILWPGPTSKCGYGLHYYRDPETGKRTSTTANRAALTLAVGPPPEPGMQAAHEPLVCHNRACVNVRHLSWKTIQENHDDKILDGTAQRRLTDPEVISIIRDQRPQQEIAAEYGIAQEYVSMIKAGKRRPRAWAKSGVPLPASADFRSWPTRTKRRD